MDPLADFQGDLDRLADLTDEELSALESRLVEAFDAADSGGDDAAAGQLADALDSVRNEIGQRSDAPPAEPVAAAADTATTDPAPTSQESTPVTASTVVNDVEPEVPEGRAPVVSSTSAVVAGANLGGYDSGQVIPDLNRMSKAMADRISTLGRVGGADGEQVLVASIRSNIPDDRFLKYGDAMGNREKIDAATNLDAITAAGGCCAPLDTRYDLFGIGDTVRPVKASLAGFGADRGGIRFFEGPTLDQIGAAVGFWTCADDAAVDADDEATWKVCARVNCPDESEALVQAVTLCLTFGVMQSRVFPEMVTANNKLALVAQARLSESALLSQIRAQSKKVTGGTVEAGLGFLRTLLDTADRAIAYYRDRHRIAANVPLSARFPVWMIQAIDADMVRQPPSTAQMADNFGMSVDEIESFFRDRNVNVAWTLDSHVPGTNGGGFYGNVADGGVLPAFPETVQWSLSIEGSFLFLDGGQLDLGIVRDSTLVRTNDYQTFTETFESAVRTGGEALWVTTPVATTGRYAGPITYPAV
ncbi:major capsid protein [Longimicrobium sp.]|jgi:hypothetical protein|uniref:major capsid protein n=1 Tax=Longimicrobium sp. TaxID=2029185 RepID=UPI002EDA6B4B